MEQTPRLDLLHLQRIGKILDGIPGDTDLPHAIIALEDAIVACSLGFSLGLTLGRTRALHWEEVTKEETRRLLAEHRA